MPQLDIGVPYAQTGLRHRRSTWPQDTLFRNGRRYPRVRYRTIHHMCHRSVSIAGYDGSQIGSHPHLDAAMAVAL